MNDSRVLNRAIPADQRLDAHGPIGAAVPRRVRVFRQNCSDGDSHFVDVYTLPERGPIRGIPIVPEAGRGAVDDERLTRCREQSEHIRALPIGHECLEPARSGSHDECLRAQRTGAMKGRARPGKHEARRITNERLAGIEHANEPKRFLAAIASSEFIADGNLSDRAVPLLIPSSPPRARRSGYQAESNSSLFVLQLTRRDSLAACETGGEENDEESAANMSGPRARAKWTRRRAASGDSIL